MNGPQCRHFHPRAFVHPAIIRKKGMEVTLGKYLNAMLQAIKFPACLFDWQGSYNCYRFVEIKTNIAYLDSGLSNMKRDHLAHFSSGWHFSSFYSQQLINHKWES
jgi:hypothetical protein